MDKKVELVLESFETWMEIMKQNNKNERIINIILNEIEDQVLKYLDNKRKKYVKIEIANRILYGIPLDPIPCVPP